MVLTRRSLAPTLETNGSAMTNSANGPDIRRLSEEEFEAWDHVTARAFGQHSTVASRAYNRSILEVDRSIAAYADGRIIGTATAPTFGLTIPGGETALPLVDSVAVQPTHRRQGILRAMMAHQMDDFHERGEFVAGLFASESGIYGRFGYGIATWCEDWTMPREHSAFAGTPNAEGSFRFVEPDDVPSLWASIYEPERPKRVGFLRFPEPVWPAFAADPEHERQRASAFFHVVYSGESGDEGFVTYRVRNDSQILVVMLLGTTSKAEAELWRFCFGIDLMTSTFAPGRPVDDPLPWMLKDPRRLVRSLRDQLWLRLVDVPAALSARSYASECNVVLDVHDSFCPWNAGRFVLETGSGGANCKQTSVSPDLELSASDLASVYLGGTTLATLERAGRVDEHRTGALRELDRALATERSPWTVIF